MAGAFLAKIGLNVSEDLVLTILGVGVVLVYSIAHEDAAAKSAGLSPKTLQAVLPDSGPEERGP